jgi:glucans biosynthesis protein C
MTSSRQYYIDWIRVIVFGVLILYHTGMFFVSWGFHLKNNEIVPGIEPFMLFFNHWRLPLLFFISGVGVSFALKSRTTGQFVLERTKRLLIPLIVGMFVIVPPQIFFERLQLEQFSGSFFSFYPKVLEFQSYPVGNFSWHHLWFLIYLFVYCLICVPLFQWLRTDKGKKFLDSLSNITVKPFTILLYAIPLMITFWFMEPRYPVTHNLVFDWYNHAFSILLFIFGYVLGSRLETWEMLEIHRKKYLLLTILLFTALYLFVYTPVIFLPLSTFSWLIVMGFLRMLVAWSIILTICGYFKHYLNKSNTFISYATEAVLPYYILHQTIIISIGYYIADWQVFWGIKFLLLAVATFGGSAIIYHFLIRPFNFIRFFFGLKMKTSATNIKALFKPALNFAGTLILLIIVFQLFVWGKAEPIVPIAMKTTAQPSIDGVLDDVAWKNALVIEDLKHDGNLSHEKTICYLTYDKDNFYIAFHAFDSETNMVKSEITEAEDFKNNNWVAFCLDTYNGEKGTFFFAVTPKRLKASGTLNYWDGNPTVDTMLVWDCATKITPEGWIAELKIPIYQLRIKKANPTIFRFKLARYIKRLNREYSYPEIYGDKPHIAQLKKIIFYDLK